MRILDFYPTKGFFKPGETVGLRLELETAQAAQAKIRLKITHLAQVIAEISGEKELAAGRQELHFSWQSPLEPPAGYGATITLSIQNSTCAATTAFDVLPDWTAFPRYGFLCDFTPGRADIAEVVKRLARYHLNGIQFYDWQYRHDKLLAPTREYVDPLQRQLSLDTVESFIRAAHQYGMAAMPYLAVYAASAKFWLAHPEWALYNQDGEPISFGEDFLGLMDPTSGSPWAEHLLDECERTLDSLPFDGLHIDQYGEPHQAWDARGAEVNLPRAFSDFIQTASERFPDKSLVFNAVGNWPIDALASAPENFEYIEVWPPDTTYNDLARIVQNARSLSGGRPVVVALYLPAERPANILLADALIRACGGSRIEMGENERLLADPYFPKHQGLTDGVKRELRRFYDFAVRYGEWSGPASEIATGVSTRTLEGIRVIPRRSSGWLALHLVNFSGLGENPCWDNEHGEPHPQENLQVQAAMPGQPKQVLWASPNAPSLQPVPHEYNKGWLECRLPGLKYWGILAIET